jgi:hypothetical protein
MYNIAFNDSSQTLAKRVFLCYCSQDRFAAERLQVHLAGCQHLYHLSVWDITHLPAGSIWQSELTIVLASAQIAVVLISADFLADTHIINHQLPSLLEAAQNKGTRILPVILGSCLFEESLLRIFLPINPKQPLKRLSPGKRDEVWVAVVRTIASYM